MSAAFFNDIRNFPNLNREAEDAIKDRIRRGDDYARRELVAGCFRLSGMVVEKFRRYANRMIDSDDLLQVANIALMRAAEQFDVDAGWRFTSYAAAAMSRAVTRYIQSHIGPLRLPNNAAAAAMGQSCNPASDAVVESARRVVYSGEHPLPAIGVFDDNTMERNDELAAMKTAMNRCLCDREIDVLVSRSEGQTLREIGVRNGLSPGGIRLIAIKAIEKLQEEMNA